MVQLDDFKYGGTNITAFRLLNPDRTEVRQVVNDWVQGELRYGKRKTLDVILQVTLTFDLADIDNMDPTSFHHSFNHDNELCVQLSKDVVDRLGQGLTITYN